MNYKILLLSLLMSGGVNKAMEMKFVKPYSFSFESRVDGIIKVQQAFASFDELAGYVNNSSNYNCFLSAKERIDGIDMKLNVSTKKVYWNLFKRFYEKGKEYTTASILKRSKKDDYFIADKDDSSYASYNIETSQVYQGQLTGMIYPTGIGWCSIFGIGALSFGIYKLWWKK